MPIILKDYTFVKDIGEGNFGKVKLSILNSTQEKYAIKILDKEKLKSQTKSTLFNEIEIISHLKHPNIIYVYNILEDDKNYYIIMEYCEKGELFDYIVEQERLSPIESSIFFYQLINGVEYIHKQGFAHRDLKPENLLLTKDKIIKIIDFGLCHDFNDKKFLKTKCGSPSYAAPEILKGFPYNGFKTDIWCCGIILYAMLCGYLPFDGDNNQEIFQSIVECEPEFPDFLEDDSINLLIWLLNPEPKERISIEDIKRHPFYIKGKNFFNIQYDIIEDNSNYDDAKNNEMKNNNFINYNSINNNNNNYTIDKRNIGFSTIRRKKGNIYTFNNIKRLKMNENRHFKNNIYQNIFNNINNLNEEEHTQTSKNKKVPYLLTSFNNNDNSQKNNLNELNNNIKQIQTKLKTEENPDKSSSIIGEYKNKLINNNLQNQNKNEKIELNFIKNNNNNINNNNNSKSQEKKYDINKLNEISLDMNKLNQFKSLDKKNRKINIYNNKFLNENIKSIFKDKNKEKHNNILDKKINMDQLDFFQKFRINKNKHESLGKSPVKNIGINCNLVLTKNKEKNKDNSLEENIEKERELSGNKKKISIKDRIILTQKKQKYDTIKNEGNAIFSNKLNIIGSPAQNINNYYQRNTNIRKNKFLNSVFGHNSNINPNDIINGKTTEGNKKINFGCRSCSIKKNHHRKNLKINVNNKLNNFKIINLNDQSNTIKKEAKNNNFILNNHQEITINNNLLSLNVVLKTEPKNNHFLDKVIQKINSNKDRHLKNKMHILMTHNNNYKNDENKQMFRFLSIEKNNNNNHEFYANPFLIKSYKNNINDEDKINKKSAIHLKEDKFFLKTINQKIENTINRKSKDKVKKIFPNLMIYNKK